MAKNDNDDLQDTSRKLKNQFNLLNQKMDALYKDTYISRPDNKKNLESISNSLDDAINKLASMDNDNIATMSELLRRIDNKNNVDRTKLNNNIQELFNDNNLVANLLSTTDVYKYIAAENANYDMICKYLPKLEIALELLRDNVLSSDNFANNFLNPKSVYSSSQKVDEFVANTDKLENLYNLSNFLSDLYYKTSKYGETFVYAVPYTKAFERLLKNGANIDTGIINHSLSSSFYESTEQFWDKKPDEVILKEGFNDTKDFKNYIENIKDSSIAINDDGNYNVGEVKLHFNESGAPINPINNIAISSYKKSHITQSIQEVFNKNKVEGNMAKEYDKLTDANDGFILDTMDKDIKIDENIIGTVLELLPREDIIPIYIGKSCLGYYYLEIKEDKTACGFCGTHHMTPMISNAANYSYEMSVDQEELVVRYIASKISQSIDSKFINSNKDLKEEIYAVLRYNHKFNIAKNNDIGVTFIPADDIIHCYFKMDERLHRGISDLQQSLIPAMLYILLYLSDIIGKITRSYDKRVYYVKQNVEQNVARTMMNVVNQIKKGNMGMRQIESMNNILNIVGKYNDYIIPLSSSGDAPIQFEVMSGQNIETPTDLMDKMEEMAINATGVPFEMVNATLQQDFAVRFSMSNTRLLKFVYERQRRTSILFSEIFTRLYNNQFNTEYSKIEIQLPPPIYLTMTNTQQLMDNITQMADKIIELELNDKDDEVKSEFKRLYIRNFLGSYLDYDFIDRLIDTAMVNHESKKNPAVEDGENSSMDDSDSSDW